MKALFILARTGGDGPPDSRARTLPHSSPTLTRLAALTPDHWEVTTIDETTTAPVTSGTYDLVGVSCTAASANRAYKLSRWWSRRGAHTLLGGVHPTLEPDEANRYADTIIVGSAEDSLPEFWEDLESGQAKTRYEGAPDPVLPPIPDVLAELAGQPDQPAILSEAVTAGNRDYALELFDAIAPLGLAWQATATLEWADDAELLAAAVRAGCREVRIDFTTTTAIAQYRDSVSCLRGHGLRVLGDFVVGNDDDTLQSLADVIEGVDQLGVDLPRFSVATPFPGTPLHRRLSRQDRILTTNLDLYDGRHVVFDPLNMTALELQDRFVRLWRAAYSFVRMARRSDNRNAWLANVRLRRQGRQVADRLARHRDPLKGECLAPMPPSGKSLVATG